MDHAVTALFDDRDEAERAVERLVDAGISRHAIRLLPEAGGAGLAGSGTADTSRDDDRSWWDSLRDLFLPDEDRGTYAEGLDRGSTMVSVQVDESQINEAILILEGAGAVDLEQRESEWREAGWTGSSGAYRSGTYGDATTAGSTGSSTAFGDQPLSYGIGNTDDPLVGASITGGAGTGAYGDLGATGARGDLGATGARGDLGATGGDQDEVIPVIEETLRVGKRMTAQGRVRMRSYVIETPVQEQVLLRDERVTVERSPVDRPLGAGDDPFQDRLIEAEERQEEAVVSKEARVREEVRVHRDVDTHTQTVSAAVRRTEVEVEDERTGTLPGSTPVRR